MAWGLGSVGASLVVVAGTQYYDGSGLGASDYPVTDLLSMMGRAGRPQVRWVGPQGRRGRGASLVWWWTWCAGTWEKGGGGCQGRLLA